MTFTCRCIHCDEPFQAKRSTAKFHADSCRKAYARNKDKKKVGQIKKLSKKVTKGVPKKVVKKVDDKVDKSEPGFIPNWKLSGFKSKEDAMIKAIGDIAGLGFPNTVVVWQGEAFVLNPSKDPVVIKKKRKKK